MPRKHDNKTNSWFKFDLRVIEKIAEKTDCEHMLIAYLTLAAGTGSDHKTSSWSTKAINRHSGMPKEAAERAIQQLMECEFIKSKAHVQNYPRYELCAYGHSERGQASTDRQRGVLDLISDGRGDQLPKKDIDIARALERKGLVKKGDDPMHFVLREAPNAQPFEVFLPMEFITGTGKEMPPIRRLRVAQDTYGAKLCLLLLEFYHVENLVEFGGVPHGIVAGLHDQAQKFTRDGLVVRAFERQISQRQVLSTDWEKWHYFTELHVDNQTGEIRRIWELFWQLLAGLEEIGLVEWVPHLVESLDPGSAILHALKTGNGNEPERKLRKAAQEAAEEIVGNAIKDGAILKDVCCEFSRRHGVVVPTERIYKNIALVSILRVRYRPITGLTRAQWADYNEQCEQHVANYKQLQRTYKKKNDEEAQGAEYRYRHA